ncbi:bifunctional nuclease family protein [Ferrimicrobium sp.]|uniref:bifunctional nuclease family protein n=1 Tax=Ferrimicrobium sp. TaxID=2926050 RepID=UPI00260D11AA|nr:bifunctional nuclease family protein [Ferrimicrobium sp.]
MVEVEVAGVKVDLRSNSPVLLLQELTVPYRVVPIFIGVPEANAIDLAIAHVDPPRPLTHDLACIFLDTLDARISQVVVTEVRNGTYIAEITVVANGIEHRISARPSDSVALAIRTGAAIYVDDAVMNSEGTVFDDTQQGDSGTEGAQEEIVGEFRDFLKSIRPEDFSEE